ncbi:DNA-binding CsgD family transcriptional regulator [Cytobacillus horneckiae]|uniref:Spore gernimation protein n=1 Tax=Cytobacillus horneckiae TaxID=549687 RepID=A0A2N0ZK19_9BACI|nr:spore gernimation protein [Cytobacillus horneckiae]MBN6887915.1 DNA-binding response regulator [Cytobacillus horneckiae]MEC1155117.1 DNA-binding response regulator [Cytobacillus horneckiae]MED2935977.1 DNA-binding response regulator [Cytobacillus horneckiae]PKG29862.1 spore gernimation protein [Cytobacillus horneckiae]
MDITNAMRKLDVKELSQAVVELLRMNDNPRPASN